MIEFAWPFAFLLLPLPFLVRWFSPAVRIGTQAVRVPFFQELSTSSTSETQLRKPSATPIAQLLLTSLVWVFLLTGLAQPQRLGPLESIESAARDVALAIDISGSMDARDMKTPAGAPRQRLQTVKDVVTQFIAEREGDRIAIVVFGTRAFLQAPFTEDLTAAADLVERTAVGMAGPHTAIGDAIGLAMKSFENSKIEEQVLILLSDGADTNSRMSPTNAAEIAAQRGVTIHTIGVGDENASGAERVDLAALQSIADQTGGRFFFAEDETALTEVYAEIDRLSPRLVNSVSYRPRTPLMHYCFAVAFVLTAAMFMIGARQSSQRRAV